MILFFYNLALLAALVAGAPWWLWRMATTQKYREGLLATPGLGAMGRGGLESLQTNGSHGAKPAIIWLHAVSVGEVLAVSRLVGELDRGLPEYRLVISTTTRTGQALARERFGPKRVFYCPLDLPWAVRANFKRSPAPAADSGGNGVLAQPAERLLSPGNSRSGGECPHLRPLLAALPAAAPALAAVSWNG